MSEIQALLDEVRAAGVTLQAEGDMIKARPGGVLSDDLKARLREKRAEVLKRLELEASMRRLEAMQVLLAINEDGDLRIVQAEADAHQAVADGYVIYTPRDAYMYVTLTEHERRLLHAFKKRFGGTTEWRER
jgi:hypothetical protein